MTRGSGIAFLHYFWLLLKHFYISVKSPLTSLPVKAMILNPITNIHRLCWFKVCVLPTQGLTTSIDGLDLKTSFTQSQPDWTWRLWPPDLIQLPLHNTGVLHTLELVICVRGSRGSEMNRQRQREE